jgi:hypothetical protein
MQRRTDRAEAEAEAVCSALRPYQWRSFRPQLLARMVLAANDRQHLHTLLTGIPGGAVGTWEPLEPADRDDGRLSALVDFLSLHRWTELSLGALCRQLLALLDDGT